MVWLPVGQDGGSRKLQRRPSCTRAAQAAGEAPCLFDLRKESLPPRLRTQSLNAIDLPPTFDPTRSSYIGARFRAH
jgi:hypothetical protein